MIIVAFGAYSDALKFALSHAAGFKKLLFVGDKTWRDQVYREPVSVCDKVLPGADGFEIELCKTCAKCDSSRHRILSYDEFHAQGRTALAAFGSVESVQECSVLIQPGRELHFITSGAASSTFFVKHDEELRIFSEGDCRDWLARSNLNLKVNESWGPGCISYFRATRDKVLTDKGILLEASGELVNGERAVSWLQLGQDTFLIKVIGFPAESTENEVDDHFKLHRLGLILGKKFRQAQEQTSMVRTLSIAALVSALKKWLVLYLLTWARVIVSMLLLARVRTLTIEKVIFYLNFARNWLERRYRKHGLQPTIMFLSSVSWFWIAFMERRVRDVTDTKFLSISVLLSVLHMLAMNLLREGSKYIWAHFLPMPALESPSSEVILTEVNPTLSDCHRVILVNFRHHLTASS